MRKTGDDVGTGEVFGSGHSIRSPRAFGQAAVVDQQVLDLHSCVTHGSCIRNDGRYFITGSSQRSLPASTSRASTLAVIALVLEAILNSVSRVDLPALADH